MLQITYKAYKIIYKAYKKGFRLTFLHVFWLSKFFLFRFFKVKKVLTRYDVKCFSDFDDATFKFYFLANYGFFYSDFLKHYSSNFVFIDVGANKGLYSVIAAKNLNCEKVISFEPIPSTYDYLTKNCSLNNIISKCELHNLAIGDACEERDISFNKLHSGTASLAMRDENEHSSVVTIRTVDKTTLNDLLAYKNKNYILKIDVEGFELTVLQELFKCDFAEAITNIFYEVDERWVSPSSIEKLLFGNGFNKFKKIGSGSHYDVMATK